MLRPQNSWAGNPRAESQAPRGAASGGDSGAADGLTVKPKGIQGGGQGREKQAWPGPRRATGSADGRPASPTLSREAPVHPAPTP